MKDDRPLADGPLAPPGGGPVAGHRAWLTDLDRAIGDGDHGINLHRGSSTAVAGLDAGELPMAPGPALFAAIGRTITGTVGGASGALRSLEARCDAVGDGCRPVSTMS